MATQTIDANTEVASSPTSAPAASTPTDAVVDSSSTTVAPDASPVVELDATARTEQVLKLHGETPEVVEETVAESPKEDQVEAETTDKVVEPATPAATAEVEPLVGGKPLHEHPRFKEVTEQRRAAVAELEKVKPLVEFGSRISQLQQQHHVSPEQLEQAVQIAGLMNSDPVQAHKVLVDLAGGLAKFTGDALDPDLQKQVDDGVLMIDHAKAWQKDRAKLQQREYNQQYTQRMTEAQRHQQATAAISEWDSAKRSSNPSYKPNADGSVGLYELVRGRAQDLFSRTPPSSTEDVIKLLEQAYVDVTKFATPAPAPVRRTLPTTSATPRAKQTEPLTPQQRTEAVLARHEADGR